MTCRDNTSPEHIHTIITPFSPRSRLIYQVYALIHNHTHTHTVSKDWVKAFKFGETFRIWTSALDMLYKHVACELH